VVDLTQQCNSLESLAGPRFAPSMSNVDIVGTSLADLGSFAPASVNELRIEDTALENLDALSQLSRATHIDIFGNRALTNADGLDALSFVGYLRIANSPLLERLPELAAMYELSTLSIIGNDALTNIPSLPNIGLVRGPAEWGNLAPEDAVRVRPDIIQISGNAALQSLVIPAGWLAVSYLDISGNEQLTRIDLGNLQAAELLAIGGNPALTSVELGSLETVDDLRIIDNPSLPLEPFDAVQTFRRIVQSGPLDFDQL
jgi:Leucine-rich repeat (LRR) protein